MGQFNLHVTAVTAVCGARNSSLCTSLGSGTTWDYTPGADGLVASFSDNQFGIVFDVIGGDLLDASAMVLKEGGIITHFMNRGTNGKDKTVYKEASENGSGPKFETTFGQAFGCTAGASPSARQRGQADHDCGLDSLCH